MFCHILVSLFIQTNRYSTGEMQIVNYGALFR